MCALFAEVRLLAVVLTNWSDLAPPTSSPPPCQSSSESFLPPGPDADVPDADDVPSGPESLLPSGHGRLSPLARSASAPPLWLRPAAQPSRRCPARADERGQPHGQPPRAAHGRAAAHDPTADALRLHSDQGTQVQPLGPQPTRSTGMTAVWCCSAVLIN